ncbi:MAG: ABC transporter substrate-binding protein/permease, partial [Lachnospiraceae bacterium]|nr:ABC transporter substrate-binding protein/permease [Lachnospiraceae bacterium]
FCTFDQAYIINPESAKVDDKALSKELNEYINRSKDNGYVDGLVEKWTADLAENITYDNLEIENPKKILRVAVPSSPPYSFISNGKFAGLDIELFESFCKEYNYGYKYEYVDFSSVIMGIATGKYDVGLGGVTITEERKKNMVFSESYYAETAYIVYCENDTDIMFLDKIKTSFYNSFIKERRYTLILYGLLVTLVITIASTVCGVMIGFLMYLLYVNGIKILNILIDTYVYLMNGIPLLVILMVLYYIVFVGLNVSGVVISIVGFSLAMGVFVFGSLVDYTKILDKGQEEASLALGYKKMDVFYKVVIPQVIINIFPAFKNRVVFLLKNTAIVGEIAVADLTKAGDIIRSRTYEAIFPLLSIALVYFIVGAIIKAILSMIEKKINPKIVQKIRY